MIQLDQYLGIFIDESRDNLQTLNETLLLLEENKDNLALLNDIFRVAHTLKGMSSTMGFNSIAELTHQMENLLDPMRNGTLKVENYAIDVLFKCLDRLETLVNSVFNGSYNEQEVSTRDLVDELKKVLSAESSQKEELEKKIEEHLNKTTVVEGANTDNNIAKEIIVEFSSECVLPCVRAYMVIKSLEDNGTILNSTPSLDDLEKGTVDHFSEFKFSIVSEDSDEKLISLIKEISEIENVLINSSNQQTLVEEAKTVAKTEKVQKDQKENANGNNQQNHQKQVAQTIRVNADKMDKLMNLVGELVISRTRISQISSELKLNDLNNAISVMGGITGDLQEIVMKLRMVPIEQVFNRFPRVVRDVSKELSKEIELIMKGQDTEIDRVVIDQIGDPLVHLIRNSLDHGIECPDEREQKGKPRHGTLELFAFNEGNNIVITVTDDGKGIDPEKIKASAIRKGLHTEESLKGMSDREIINLIFMPGLSTSTVATDISGRGVGMDVVKTKVAALGGNVYIESKINEGTKITITLPSTMAIVQSLLIKVGDETFAMPLNYISEVIDIQEEQIKRIQKKEVVVLRAKTLPLIRMNQLLNINTDSEEDDKALTVVIVKLQEHFLGLIVSELIGQQEVVIKPINKNLSLEDYISGATTLGNGEVALILNVNSFFKKS